jgi:hypothetical protein
VKLLFNHGLNGRDLFIGVPAKISILGRTQFLKHQIDVKTKEEGLGLIFEYFIAIVIRLMIIERKRFVFPS